MGLIIKREQKTNLPCKRIDQFSGSQKKFGNFFCEPLSKKAKGKIKQSGGQGDAFKQEEKVRGSKQNDIIRENLL